MAAIGMSTPGRRQSFIHTNACGDFTLMAREHWFDLRGYPEFDLFSMNLDSVLLRRGASWRGARRDTRRPDADLSYRTRHRLRLDSRGPGETLRAYCGRGLSFVDNEEVLGWAAQMSRLNSPMIFNHENWGLAEFDLKETVLPELDTTLRVSIHKMPRTAGD